MKRETRVNLIFLIAFLAISLPGAVILFRKKLEPNARRMDLLSPTALTTTDPELLAAIHNEERRQRDNLELIASGRARLPPAANCFK